MSLPHPRCGRRKDAAGTVSDSHRHYRVYGLRLCANVSLPELVPDSFEERDIAVCVVADPSGVLVPFTEWVERERFTTNLGCDLVIYDAGTAKVLRWEGKCDFYVDPLRGKVTILPRPETPMSWVTTTLYGMVLAFVLHVLGRPSFHGSAVAIPGGAVAFLAESGTGKSTLAARLAHSGLPLITDDVVALRPFNGGFAVQPAFPWISLSEESVKGVFGAAVVPAGTFVNGDKLRMPLNGSWGTFCSEATPLRALFVLNRRAPTTSVDRERVSPAEAVRLLTENTLCLPFLRGDALQRHMSAAASIVAQIPVWRLQFPGTFAPSKQLFDWITSAARQPKAVA